MKKRELGFYWVKYIGEWIIAEYTNSYVDGEFAWFHCGNECESNDDYFDEINENRIIYNG